MQDHPYTNLPKHAFWKTAVAELDPRQIDLAWNPKSPISRTSVIITAGSCFARHISKALKENGFNWLDSEPAPAVLPPAGHGYGAFSFRTGNIYTAALLRQWVMWATGAGQSTESFLDNGRYFDPFRPSLTTEGYSSAGEMLAARKITLAAILDAIKRADLFVFTLGLTEAWLNRNGSVYPMCPGTIRGKFSAADHVFHNYSEQEILRDLTATFDELRGVNPKLRFLLTVSPVPLTATASGQHVLTATAYSKSALRSAAGYLAQSREDTDYFPSYELITAPAFKGQFFEQNMRSVSAGGVAFVMDQFFRGIEAAATPAVPEIVPAAEHIASGNPATSGTETGICDDIILETWSNKPIGDAEYPPNILLIGDSQMGMVARILDEQCIRYAGGAIMHGSEWHGLQFALLDDFPYFTPAIAGARARWEQTCEQGLLKTHEPSGSDLWIITNVGCHANDLAATNGFAMYLQNKHGAASRAGQMVTATIDDLRDYLLSSRRPHLDLVNRFRKAGFKTIWVSDPPVNLQNADLMGAAEQILSEEFAAIGCLTFLSGKWVSDDYGALPAEFLSSEIDPSTGRPDVIHGSLEYYRQLMQAIFSRFPIKPRPQTVRS